MKPNLPDYVLLDRCPFCQSEMVPNRSYIYYFCSSERKHPRKMIWFSVSHSIYLRELKTNSSSKFDQIEVSLNKTSLNTHSLEGSPQHFDFILSLEDLITLDMKDLKAKLFKLSNFQ